MSNYEHLCQNLEAHRLYHVIGKVCPCPEPCESCGGKDLDSISYGPDPTEVMLNEDYTPKWLCKFCAQPPSADSWAQDSDGDFMAVFE